MDRLKLRKEEDQAIAEAEEAFRERQEAFRALHDHLNNHPDITINDDFLEKFEKADLRFRTANTELHRIADEIRLGLR